MSKIEIVIEEQLTWEEANSLIHLLDETVDMKYTILSVGITDVPSVQECLKEVCESEG